jgi:uncharacterized peroxidase-related enzyme
MMPQPDRITALKAADLGQLNDDMRAVFEKCIEKLGFVPNVLNAYALRPKKLATFMALYNELMLGDSALTKLEREMIAVVVSSANHCYYCLVAHGQAVRQLSGDPQLGEMLVMNYRVAELPQRQRAMLDFAWKMTVHTHLIGEDDRQILRDAGFDDEAIFDIADVAGFYNMSNRMASAIEMIPNPEYHLKSR